MIMLILVMLLSFNCSAAELPENTMVQTSYDVITEELSSEELETTEQPVMDDSTILQGYDIKNLVSFSYIRELPDTVTLADFYILVCRIYNLILMAVWTLIAFEVIDLVARSIGRLKRKN